MIQFLRFLPARIVTAIVVRIMRYRDDLLHHE